MVCGNNTHALPTVLITASITVFTAVVPRRVEQEVVFQDLWQRQIVYDFQVVLQLWANFSAQRVFCQEVPQADAQHPFQFPICILALSWFWRWRRCAVWKSVLVKATVIEGALSSSFIKMSTWLFPEQKKKKKKMKDFLLKKRNIKALIHDRKFVFVEHCTNQNFAFQNALCYCWVH